MGYRRAPGRIFRRVAGFAGKHPWRIFLVILLLVALYWQPGKWFSDPACTVLYDRNGSLLGAKIADDGQWRFPETDTVPGKFSKALLAGEDKYFFFHPGFNPVSLTRAAIQYFRNGRIISGGSTLTMQVVRMSGKDNRRTIFRKLFEIIQAFRLELTHSKQEILALYASHAPFGGNVVGIEAASWRYFGIPSADLSWAQTATLAVLPNAPSLVFPGKNEKRLLQKRNSLLAKMQKQGIITREQLDLAVTEPLPGHPLPLPRIAPHLTERVARTSLSGKPVITTLKKDFQERVNDLLVYHSAFLNANEIRNAAAIVVDVEHGEVMAYSGNLPGNGRNGCNQVDIITAPRSSGSILKPFLYALSLNEGLILPGTLLPDIPTQIGGFVPENFNLSYDGAVPAREALARSLNIPAVRLLQMYGYDPFYGNLRKLGMTTLTRPADHYGLSLILGGAEAELWDLAAMYASMARTLNHFTQYGKYDRNDFREVSYVRNDPKVRFSEDHSVLDAASIWLTFEAMVEVVRPGDELRWQQFSSGSRIAWKTGTSYGNRDGWAVGVTPGYVVAVWTGNATGEGRPGLTGLGCAAPILFDIFRLLPPTSWFAPPYKEMISIPVCGHSGHRASGICSPVVQTWIPQRGLQSGMCPFHRLVHLDTSGKWQVTSSCEPPSKMKHLSWFVLPPAQEWFFRMKNPFYQTLPPFRTGCSPSGFQIMEMIYPENNSRIYVPVDIDGRLGGAVFRVAHRIPGHKIYWHLDDVFLGTTMNDHQMALSPSKGMHRLTLVDQSGETIGINFEILSSGIRNPEKPVPL